MKVLVVGSGGREHALVWKLAQSRRVEKIFCAPGNAGIAEQAECVDIKADDIPALADFAEKRGIGLTVVGPEAALCAGIADEFEKRGLRIFGPSKKAAEIEGSKVFAKQLMKKYKIPTAKFEVFDDAERAIDYINENRMGKVVVKADGLASGKGVLICKGKSEAVNAVKKVMAERAFGDAGKAVVVEEMLEGEEASYLVFSDGRNILPMVSAQDHKRALDLDKGPNTGGMGACSPAPVVTPAVEKKIIDEIMKPTVEAMRKEGGEYRGVLYAGVMVDSKGQPRVLEFNARFGDPETQAVLPRMESDLLDVMEACIGGRLAGKEIKWKADACTCVVLASGGYPGSYEKGKEISGIAEANQLPGVVVFHAGTRKENGKTLTDGGRVLGVSALGGTIRESVKNAYAAVGKIKFRKMHFRKDIGKRAIRRKAAGNGRKSAGRNLPGWE